MPRQLPILLLTLFAVAELSRAQSVTGRISGTIVDQQFAVIVGAEVVLT